MKKISSLLFTLLLTTISYAGEFNDALKNGILVISTTKDYWIEGIQKSNYNLTDLEIIPNDKGTAKDGMIYFYSTFSKNKRGSYFKLYFKHKSKVYKLDDFQFIITDNDDVRRFMHHIENIIENYIKYADENGKLNTSEIEKQQKKIESNWGKNIKNSTYYVVGDVSSSRIKNWDKKNYGKVKKVSPEDLNRIIENGEDSTGYYIVYYNSLPYIWMAGAYTLGAGFIITAPIPKHKVFVYSTSKDQFITSFRSYNPTIRINRIQKRIKKAKSLNLN